MKGGLASSLKSTDAGEGLEAWYAVPEFEASSKKQRLPVSVEHEWIPGPPNWRDMGDGARCVPECSIGITQPNVAGQGVIGTKEKKQYIYRLYGNHRLARA